MKSAFSKSISTGSLHEAWLARKAKLLGSCFGIDRVTGKAFQGKLNSNLSQLSKSLAQGYQPNGLLAFPKEKDSGGYRIICVPTVSDRLVQESLLQQLRPRFKASKIDNPVSYGLAREKARSIIGARDFACKNRNSHPWVYKTDIHKFFDNVDRGILKVSLKRVVRQTSLRSILEAILESEITDGIEPNWKAAVKSAGIEKGRGVRQGMPLSPFFAGAYLLPLDLWLEKQQHPSARYVDDIVVFFDAESEARKFHSKLEKQMTALGLVIGEIDDPQSKTDLYSPSKSADFLGMQITMTEFGYKLLVSQKTIEKVKVKIAELAKIETLLEKDQRLTTFGSYFEAIDRGYANAYDGAHNIESFRIEVSKFLGAAKDGVLHELFGDRLVTLTPAEKKFAEIE